MASCILNGFAAILYSQNHGAELKSLVCPPYDLIGQKEALRLSQHPHAFVRLENPRLLFEHTPYQTGRATMLRWLEEGVLKQDKKPSVYLLQQTFQSKGNQVSRRCLVGLLPIEQAKIHPHERTLGKPKQDRMRLLRQTGMQVSGAFLIANVEKRKWDAFFKRKKKEKVYSVATDGALHALYRLNITRVKSLLHEAEFLIADGHHRYESLCQVSQIDKRVRSIFSFITNLSEPLPLLPIHRILPEGKKIVERDLKTYFFHNDEKAPVKLWYDGRVLCCLSPKKREPFIEVKAVDHLLGRWGILRDEVRYLPGFRSLRHETRNKRYGFEMKPYSAEEVFSYAKSRGVLPPKTTYFCPKIPSGMLFYRMW